MTIVQLITNIENSFSTTERTNFKNLWDGCASFCRPVSDNIISTTSKGSQRTQNRLVDIGIRSLNTFASGLSSALTPKGTKFIEYDIKGDKDNEVQRWIQNSSATVMDYITDSNLFEELSKAFSDLGLFGTALTMTESDLINGLRFKTFPIVKFTFQEDSKGNIDTVYFKVSMTNGQLLDKFDIPEGEFRRKLEDPAKSQEDNVLYQAISPRKKFNNKSISSKNWKYESIWIHAETKTTLETAGYKLMPCSISRWNQATDEIYGRSPAMECLACLNMLNVMEDSKLRSAQRLASPQWLAPSDGSTRNINNNAGGVIYYNPTNPAGKPEQILQRDMPQITQEIIKEKQLEVEQSFFVPIFNPLAQASANPTATEVNARSSIASADLVPKVNRIINEFLRPMFIRAFWVLLDDGKLPKAPMGLQPADLNITFESRASKILELIEAQETTNFMAQVVQVAQVDPTVIDLVDIEGYINLLAIANAIPTSVLRSEYDVRKIRNQRALQQQAQQEQEQSQAEAEVLSKTNKDSALGQSLGME